jgi:hypothetical protein
MANYTAEQGQVRQADLYVVGGGMDVQHLGSRLARLGRLVVLTLGVSLAFGSSPGALAAGPICNSTQLSQAVSTGGSFTSWCNGTITVGEIVVTANTTLDATGFSVVLQGNGSDRVFTVNPGVSLTLVNLTVTNGSGQASTSNSSPGNGGGIYNAGRLTLLNSTVSNNGYGAGVTPGAGGGIYNAGTLTLTNSTVKGNQDTNGGAGIDNEGSGTVSMTTSTVSENTATNGAGGIVNLNASGQASSQASVTISRSTVSGNSAPNGFAGGIDNQGTMSLSNSTIAGNTATNGFSGGIYNNLGGSLVLTNDTISANAGGTGPGRAAGLAAFASNSVTMTNTIVAKQTGGGADCGLLASGAIVSQGHNLDSDNSCSLTAQGDVSGQDPHLGPLAQNQPGTTETMALLPGSPAIARGNNSVCSASPVNGVDQRRVTRALHFCDIGAYDHGNIYLPLVANQS